MHPVLTVRNLSTGYGKKPVLFDVNCEAMHGEIVLISGGNGSGKSTLLKAIYGLILPWNADAEVVFRPVPSAKPLPTFPPSRNLCNGLAYLPQRDAVFDDLTIDENFRMIESVNHSDGDWAERRSAVLEVFPALKGLMSRKPGRLSGGERQCTALAMVLMAGPRLILLDEPLGGLDRLAASGIVMMLDRIRRMSEVTLVVAEHRIDEMMVLNPRILKLELGRLVSDQSAELRRIHP